MGVHMRHSKVADAALKAIDERKKAFKKDSERKEYKTRTKNFPVMILQSGFAQSLGFLYAKGPSGNGYKEYKDDFLKVLAAAAKDLPTDPSELHRHVIQADLARYRQLSHYALEAAGWLKRIAETALEGEA